MHLESELDRKYDAEPLISPHFDDEATLLSARPVVPLTEVKSRSLLRRILPFLATAILGGLLTGVILLQLGRDTNPAKVDLRDPSNDSTVRETPTASSENGDSSATEVKEQKLQEPATPAAQQPARNPRSSQPKAASKKTAVTAETEQQEDDIADQALREERREARRLQRRAEREARRNARGDDLFRIRDIFEGSRRP
jgi:flagellar biosynthesis GTPase FlhF